MPHVYKAWINRWLYQTGRFSVESENNREGGPMGFNLPSNMSWQSVIDCKPGVGCLLKLCSLTH